MLYTSNHQAIVRFDPWLDIIYGTNDTSIPPHANDMRNHRPHAL
jgi:hypothetical protein